MGHSGYFHMLKNSFIFMTLLAASLIGISTVYQQATIDALPEGNWNWIVICYHLDPILIPSCGKLVSADNFLTSEGKSALEYYLRGSLRLQI
jgi:hypothetical protein